MAADMIIKKHSAFDSTTGTTLSIIRAYAITGEGQTWLEEYYDGWDLDDGIIIPPELLDEEIDRMQECGLTVVKKF